MAAYFAVAIPRQRRETERNITFNNEIDMNDSVRNKEMRRVLYVTTPEMYGEWLMRQPRRKLKGWQKELRNRKNKKKH